MLAVCAEALHLERDFREELEQPELVQLPASDFPKAEAPVLGQSGGVELASLSEDDREVHASLSHFYFSLRPIEEFDALVRQLSGLPDVPNEA